MTASNLSPIDTRRRFNVDALSDDVVWRCINVETTSCVYRKAPLADSMKDLVCEIFDIEMWVIFKKKKFVDYT